jgi:hypothetical protein
MNEGPLNMLLTALAGNAILLSLLSYLAAEIRRDVRDVRDKVIVLWTEREERREGIPAYTPISQSHKALR